MKMSSTVYVLLLFLVLPVSQVHAYLYATEFNVASSSTTSSFYRINPITGVADLIGNTGTARLTGLAVDTDGTVYTANEASSSYLHALDPDTGALTSIGRIGTRTHYEGDLAVDPNTGTLYYATSTNSYGTFYDTLYRLDKTSGAATKIGDFNLPGVARDVSGLAFVNGTLYGLATMGSTYSDALITIDVTTGAATLVGYAGTGFDRLAGMAYDPISGITYVAGAIYDGGPQKLYSMDLATGTATWLTDITGMAYDLSGLFSTGTYYPKGGGTVPIPGSFLLLFSGLMGIVSAGRRV